MMVSVIIAAALIHPDMIAYLGSEGPLTFLGLPVAPMSYASSVFPIILALWLLSYLEKLLNRLIPDMVKIIFVPLISLAVLVPFTLLVDADHTLAQAYGTWGEKKMMGRTYMGMIRTTYIIAPDGTIEHLFQKVNTKDHFGQILEWYRGQNR